MKIEEYQKPDFHFCELKVKDKNISFSYKKKATQKLMLPSAFFTFLLKKKLKKEVEKQYQTHQLLQPFSFILLFLI